MSYTFQFYPPEILHFYVIHFVNFSPLCLPNFVLLRKLSLQEYEIFSYNFILVYFLFINFKYFLDDDNLLYISMISI